jgi:formylglycine-generating enzyme required for sulfatase activity
MVETNSYHAFISYRREGGIYIARALRDGITLANPRLRVFLDTDELAAGNFNDTLLRTIAETPNFITVLSHDALARCHNEGDWLHREILAAVETKRNIIPVFESGVDFPKEGTLPQDISSIVNLNGVEYSPTYHHDAVKKIISFFKIDSAESDSQRRTRISDYFSHSMVQIPGGEFMMGSDRGRLDERPVRSVKVKESWIMKCPVTQREYDSLMNVNPSNFKHDHKPVQNISWFDAVRFCNKWSIKDGLTPVYGFDKDTNAVWIRFQHDGYRLPTEAEWEYACRAGTGTEFHWGDLDSEWDKYAWHDRNSDDQVHVVATRRPNAWGLYDMTGNVFEWCNDWYAADYYSFNECDNPKGPSQDFGEYRVMRGGAWAYDPLRLRSAARLKRDPNLTDDVSGFRCITFRHPLANLNS